MSFENPTPIRIGMNGTFNGRRYRVAGRVVMGVEVDGENYFWNEFHLVCPEGREATLVYEEGESGGEWRIFTLFDPGLTLTAAEAAAKRVGDRLNLDGHDMRVTLVDESRVYHIEGEAPEGVELGDVAHYFNAETGNRMVVVSWTGEEVEFYRGVDVSPGLVAGAFGLRAAALSSLGQAASLLTTSSFDGSTAVPNLVVKILVGFLAVVIGVVSYSSCSPRLRRPTLTRIAAPRAPLTLGAEGRWETRTWQVQGHIVADVREVGQRFDRHEYLLVNDQEHRARLICGLKPGDKEWFFFTPIEPTSALTPQQAAALRGGDTVNVDGNVATVTGIFQSVTGSIEARNLPGLRIGVVSFGFVARANATLLCAQWNAEGIEFYRGKPVMPKDVTSVFSSKTKP